MNNKVLNAIAFLLGAGVGSIATWKLVETKYKKLAQEEIDSVREVYSKKEIALNNEVKKAHACLEANTKNDNVPSYTNFVKDIGYHRESEEEESMSNIYVISPDSYGELGYEEVSLTYYADDVLAYDDDSVIRNVDKVVGKGSLNTFGEYEDDSVFVRDYDKKIDYEILRDTRKYSDVVGNDPNDSVNMDE